MRKIIFSMGIILFLSKIMGFFREIILSYYFGASNITDIYLIAISIPNIILYLIGAAIAYSYIPVYTEIKEEKGQEEGFYFTSNLINCFLVIIFIIAIIIYFFTEEIVQIFAPGFEVMDLKLTVLYTKILLPLLFLNLAMNIFKQFVQANNKFLIVAFQGIPLNVIYILGTYIAYKKGNIYLPIFSVIAVFFSLLFILIPLQKIKYKYFRTIDIKDKNLKKMLFLSIPGIIGASLEQINYLIDKRISSQIMIGGISILNYASRLNVAIVSLLIMPITTVVFPKISTFVVNKQKEELENIIVNSLSVVIFIVLPFVFTISLLKFEIIEFIFGRGKFNEIEQTGISLAFYTFGLIGIGLREILIRIFYSYKNPKIPLLNSILGILLNIFLNIVLSKYIGLSGIALATSISINFTTILLLISLKLKYKNFSFKKIGINFIKCLVSSLSMYLVIYIIQKTLIFKNSFLLLLISFSIGGIFYIIMLIILKVELVTDNIVYLNKYYNMLRHKKK